jgi:hypothetical protein
MVDIMSFEPVDYMFRPLRLNQALMNEKDLFDEISEDEDDEKDKK